MDWYACTALFISYGTEYKGSRCMPTLVFIGKLIPIDFEESLCVSRGKPLALQHRRRHRHNDMFVGRPMRSFIIYAIRSMLPTGLAGHAVFSSMIGSAARYHQHLNP